MHFIHSSSTTAFPAKGGRGREPNAADTDQGVEYTLKLPVQGPDFFTYMLKSGLNNVEIIIIIYYYLVFDNKLLFCAGTLNAHTHAKHTYTRTHIDSPPLSVLFIFLGVF